MGIFFEPYQADSCCLCGSSESLTGEHKIKASALRKIFGKDAMVIGNFDGERTLRSAQGPKSQAFHFSARMCSLCNSTRTQAADHEFDRFHALVSSLLSEGRDPSLVFNFPQYNFGSEAYLNIFRYFSKILCCHVAESSGPRPLEACEFAMGKTSRNIVFLYIDIDPTYEAYRDRFVEHQFAGHGGLIVPFDSKTQNPTGFRSSISLGAVRYIFWVKFNAMIGIVLRRFHYEFWRKCEAACQDALKNPLSKEQRHRLGL
ncbi:hypothetical protein [Erwinia sorbitola]|uniref:Uncharacterized protein n=1 Tax=Erwinia sorbitola TaxID=2681984 RepID=A0A6I6ENM3_9GAMM|nr:hypothetical protein [Erwinia sorbitola]QGU86669.1 hypothetical protein GN242_05295 [Erwinia sorbitola]